MQRALVKSLDGKMYYGDVDVSKTQHSHILVKKVAQIKRMPHGFMTELLHIDMAVQYRKIWLNPKEGKDLYDGFSELMFLYDAENGTGQDKKILDFLSVGDPVQIVTLKLDVLGQAEPLITALGVITSKDKHGIKVADENGTGLYISLDMFRGFNSIFIQEEGKSPLPLNELGKKITFDFSRAAIRNETLIKIFEDEAK